MSTICSRIELGGRGRLTLQRGACLFTFWRNLAVDELEVNIRFSPSGLPSSVLLKDSSQDVGGTDG